MPQGVPTTGFHARGSVAQAAEGPASLPNDLPAVIWHGHGPSEGPDRLPSPARRHAPV